MSPTGTIKEKINANPAAAGVVAVALLGAALLVVLLQFREPPSEPHQAFYLDPHSDTFFAAEADALPPVPTPDERVEGIRARIYACGDCPVEIAGTSVEQLTESGAFVHYFERYPEPIQQELAEYRARQAGAGADDQPPLTEDELERMDELMQDGLEVRRPEDEDWVPQFSARGRDRTASAAARCEERGSLTRCRP